MNSVSPWQLLLGTGVLFGLGLPLSHLAGRAGVDVTAFALWPTLAAAIGLAALGWRRHGPLRITGRLIGFGVLAGTLGHAVPASAAFWLARETGPGFAALAYTMPPIATLALALTLRIESPAGRRVAAVGLGFAGALLLVAGRLTDSKPGLAAIGALLLIPLSIAGANVYRGLHLPRSVPGEWLAALTLFSSATVLTAFTALLGSAAAPPRIDALVWLGLQAIAMFAAYLLFFSLQRKAEPVTVSFVGYVSMATGMAAGVLVFGDPVTALVWPALGLIAASMWFIRSAAMPVTAANRATPETLGRLPTQRRVPDFLCGSSCAPLCA